MLSKVFLASMLTATALGCADHSNHLRYPHARRDVYPAELDPGREVTDWTYQGDHSEWGRLNPKYYLCQNGTQQAPIGLTSAQGFSSAHRPTFNNYAENITGNYFNWGVGPAFTPHHDHETLTSLPSITFDGTTSYMVGWHIHAPAEHPVNGKRSRAELHLVHKDEEDHYVGVLAIRIDPGPTNSSWVDQWPWTIGFNETRQLVDVHQNLSQALEEVNYFDNFWTYQGGLTVPPCKEGIRFFMAEKALSVGTAQLQRILGMSTYSARAEQAIWLQGVNQ